jgi:peroxiredoxin
VGLPFELLSHSRFAFVQPVRFPTCENAGTRLMKRFTIAAVNGIIRMVFYPVFPPGRNAEEVAEWLKRGVGPSP